MNLTEKEFRTFLVLAKKALWAGKEEMRRMQAIGLNLTPASFYSSAPLVATPAVGRRDCLRRTRHSSV